MIEQVIKAVKRGNKKRSKNITIGAVVGFLLSCTAAMGADEYLWIKNDRGTIKFNTAGTNDADGAGGNWNENDPYSDGNIWDIGTKTYINNMTLSSSANNGKNEYSAEIGYGLRLSGDLSEWNLINNGSITAAGTNNSYGIYTKGAIANLINNGSITVARSSYSYGIFTKGTIANLINNGSITGIGSTDGNGIQIENAITNLINNGLILGIGSSNSSIGIYNSDSGGSIETLVNRGSIIAAGTYAYGIFNASFSKMKILANNGLITAAGKDNGSTVYVIDNEYGTIGNLINNGLIAGKGSDGAVGINSRRPVDAFRNIGVIYGRNEAVSGGSASMSNYGILAKGTNGAVTGMTVANYGLYIAGSTGVVTAGGLTLSGGVITTGYDEDGTELKRAMTVKNADIPDGSGTGTSTESIVLESNNYENYIFNGKDETLKVSGTGKEVKGSVINAYETAVKFDTGGGELALSGTIVNGGINEGTPSNTISGSDNADTLTLQSVIINYENNAAKTQNTIINGNIDMGAGNDALTIGSGTIVNGTIDGGAGDDVLNFGVVSKSRSNSSGEEGINILYDISDFENMNINENINLTLFEDINITGLKEIKIAETGILSLRLKDSGTTVNDGNGNMIPKAVHALIGNNMIIHGEGNGVDIAGTLNFVTKEIGREIYVDMTDIELRNLHLKASSVIDGYKVDERVSVIFGAYSNLNDIYRPENTRPAVLGKDRYDSLNNVYKGIYSSTGENLNALRTLISFDTTQNNYDESTSDEEQLKNLMSYLSSIYTESPYSFSSELSRKSLGMFRDIVTENIFRPELNKWMIMGGLTHADGGTKDTYYGQNYHGFDTGTADTDVDMKLTGAYALGKYGYSENISLGVTAGGNKSEAELSMSKVKGNSGYIGAFAENYRGNLALKAGAGIQYSEYDADRRTIGGHSYGEKYSDMAYDIYLNGRYSYNIGENLFLEPYGTLSYTYIDQDSADEGNKALAIETDSKTFDYTTAKAGIDIKKVIPHEKGKSTVSAGVSYTRILDGADEEYITGRFKGGSDFDILVAHKNEHSIGLNAKYALELENGIIFEVKGSYAVERDSHNGTGRNKTKGEWIVGAGLGYRF